MGGHGRICLRIRTGPVSYTHLDVYKRQAFENGSAYTLETYLKAPEDGEYTMVLSGIGGTISLSLIHI